MTALQQPIVRPLRNAREQTVLWPDCDPAGILFYGNYFRWMDDATYFLFLSAGLRKERMLKEHGVPGMPLVAAHADFRSPAVFGDVLTVESTIGEVRNRTFTVMHTFRIDDRLTAEGYEKRVWVKAEPGDLTKFSAVPIPDAIREVMGFQ